MKNNSLKIKLNAIYLLIFSTTACYYPFLTLYFEKKGMSYSKIGILYAVNSLVAVIFQPIWGIVTDRYSSKKFTLILTMAVSSILILNFIAAKSFYFILFSIILFMSFESPIISVNDAYCYELIDRFKGIQYGRIRLMGSAGYAIVALALGLVIKQTSINIPFVFYIIIAIFVIGFYFSIDYKGISGGSAVNLKDISRILNNKKFILLILSAMFVNISTGSNGSYISVLVEKTGGNVANIGTLWFIIAMSELPAFFFGNKLIKRFGILNLYLLSMFFYIARFFIDSLCTGYIIVLFVQLLQGLTYSLFLLSTLQYISQITPSKTRTTAFTVFNAMGSGLGGLIGNIGGGYILQYTNVFLLYKIMALVCIVALFIGIILKKTDMNNV